MTITELCEMSPDELDKMSYAELEAYFKPYWPTTRPERKDKPESKLVSAESMSFIETGRRGKKQSRVTNPQQLAFEAGLTPEKIAFLKENGML